MALSVLDMIRNCIYRQPKTVLDTGKRDCKCIKDGTCALPMGEQCPYNA